VCVPVLDSAHELASTLLRLYDALVTYFFFFLSFFVWTSLVRIAC
jgi:hypothetical protein